MTINLNYSSSSNFQMVFPELPFDTTKDDSIALHLNITTTAIPEISIEPHEMHWKGNRSYGSALGITYSPLNTNFFIDENFNNYRLLYTWMMKIRDGIENFHGKDSTDFQVDANILVMDNFNSMVAKFEYKNIWPTSLGDLELTYQDSEAMLLCAVTFTYDYFKLI